MGWVELLDSLFSVSLLLSHGPHSLEILPKPAANDAEPLLRRRNSTSKHRRLSQISGANIWMDFDIVGDVNGDAIGSCINFEERTNDAILENSGDTTLDIKLDDDSHSPEGELFQLEDLEVVDCDEPYLGQEFETEAAAHAFYNTYATRVGFVIRVSKLSRSRRDGSAIGRALVCNKEGFRMPDKREKVVRQRTETRVGCRAMILVRKVSCGKWVVTKFVKEHTHPLTPGKGRRDLIIDQYPNEHDKIRELSQQLAIEKKKVASYKRHLEMIFEHIEEHNQSLSNKIQDIVKSVREMEESEDQVGTSSTQSRLF